MRNFLREPKFKEMDKKRGKMRKLEDPPKMSTTGLKGILVKKSKQKGGNSLSYTHRPHTCKGHFTELNV